MEKDHYGAFAILLCIIAIAAFGGAKNAQNSRGLLISDSLTQTVEQPKQIDLQQKVAETQKQVDSLKQKLQAEEDAKIYSKYRGLVTIQYANHSNDIKTEYIVLHMLDAATTSIPITGWRLHSLSSGVSVTIPTASQLFFAGTLNSESGIVLTPGDTLYLSTSISPNGSSFRLNKCSGYLTQFQTFTPYLSTSCPRPRNEDLSSIPRRVENDACFDYIDSFPTCRIQTETLPLNWSYECKTFIYNKINYPSCVDTHKNDADFYQKEWRVYLKRSEPIWKNSREEIVLYDLDGKIVSDLKY